jgi:hypothetical protein
MSDKLTRQINTWIEPATYAVLITSAGLALFAILIIIHFVIEW